MSGYTVNATMSVSAWVYVEADTPSEALAMAREVNATDFDYDLATAEIDFNVTPEVDPA